MIRTTGAAERPRQFLSTRLRIGVGIDAMKPRFESADRPWAVDCAVQVAPAALQSEASGECHRTIRWSSRRCLLEVVLRYGSNPHIPASHERAHRAPNKASSWPRCAVSRLIRLPRPVQDGLITKTLK